MERSEIVRHLTSRRALAINEAEVIALQLAVWISTMTASHHSGMSTVLIGLGTVGLASGIVLLVIGARHGRHTFRLLRFLVYDASLLIVLFADLYWAYGGGRNFSVPLSHFDSVYFSVGTLSTIGAGNITPLSTPAHAIQMAQMLVDLVFVLIAVTAVTGRLTAYRPPAQPGSAGSAGSAG
jgi:hypothetical protein